MIDDGAESFNNQINGAATLILANGSRRAGVAIFDYSGTGGEVIGSGSFHCDYARGLEGKSAILKADAISIRVVVLRAGEDVALVQSHREEQ